LVDRGTESIASHANVDDVFPAEHPFVRIFVSVCGHADLGTMDRRVAAAHALLANCTLDHAQRLKPFRFTLRCDRDVCADADCDDYRCHAIPSDARLRPFRRMNALGHKQTFCSATLMSALPPKAGIVCDAGWTSSQP